MGRIDASCKQDFDSYSQLSLRIICYQGDEYFVHFRYKMYNFAKDVLEDFPPLLGPNLVAATSAIRAKYNLIRATEDVGLNLSRFFAIPTLPFSNSLGIQPSFNLITSEALIHLAKALIKILGDDQAAFSLYLRKRLNPSCEFTHRIFVWPAVFVSFFLEYFYDIYQLIYRWHYESRHCQRRRDTKGPIRLCSVTISHTT